MYVFYSEFFLDRYILLGILSYTSCINFYCNNLEEHYYRILYLEEAFRT